MSDSKKDDQKIIYLPVEMKDRKQEEPNGGEAW